MGMADYMSRNPNQLATPLSTYAADFIIAQINVIKDTLNITTNEDDLRKRILKKLSIQLKSKGAEADLENMRQTHNMLNTPLNKAPLARPTITTTERQQGWNRATNTTN